MLGCQDFCGYYEWTFHYARRLWGQAALASLLRKAIGGESQRHYKKAGARAGLKGLYDTWTKTGEDEHCDWTFTLDESKNVLRCDMRRCPSKGFLTEHDLHADEDYCDHCAGWMIPLLESIGAELAEHEHNHCGQCWSTIRMKHQPSDVLNIDVDIRNDSRWRHGYLDRWENGRPQALVPSVCPSRESCDVLTTWFAHYPALTVLTNQQPALPHVGTPTHGNSRAPILTTDTLYVDQQHHSLHPAGVLIEHSANALPAVAERFHATPKDNRPLLLHPFLPALPPIDFLTFGLPRPVPILPLLIRTRVYTHRPGSSTPAAEHFLDLLIKALRSG